MPKKTETELKTVTWLEAADYFKRGWTLKEIKEIPALAKRQPPRMLAVIEKTK